MHGWIGWIDGLGWKHCIGWIELEASDWMEWKIGRMDGWMDGWMDVTARGLGGGEAAAHRIGISNSRVMPAAAQTASIRRGFLDRPDGSDQFDGLESSRWIEWIRGIDPLGLISWTGCIGSDGLDEVDWLRFSLGLAFVDARAAANCAKLQFIHHGAALV